MTKTQIIDEVLNQLQIGFHKITLQDGILYFCSLGSGQTFDAFLGVDERISLWRFVAEYPSEKAGAGIGFCEPQNPSTVYAIEINEDGELYCSAEQVFDPNGIDNTDRIMRLIRTYLEINSEVENVAQWLIQE